MREEELEKLKSIERALLKEFIACCEELSLSYYVLGGTMLGSVRHKGFIPWDDDVDVGMMRDDYEVFLKKAPGLLPDYYFLQTLYSEPEYLNCFAKLRDSRTTYLESSVKDCRINHGVFLDIFPLDYYPDSKTAQVLFDIKYKLLSLRIRNELTLSENSKHSKAEESVAKVIAFIMSLKYKNVRDALLAQDDLCRSIKASSWIANHNGAWGKKETVPKEWFGEGVWGEFEGLSVRLPSKYENWLTQVYGDYMKLPPLEKRQTHHYTEIIDLDNPYKIHFSE